MQQENFYKVVCCVLKNFENIETFRYEEICLIPWRDFQFLTELLWGSSEARPIKVIILPSGRSWDIGLAIR